MAKAGELDWGEELKKTEEYKHVPTALWAADNSGGKQGGVDPLNKAKKINEDGEEPYRPSDKEVSDHIMKGFADSAQGQWKDSEHLHKEIVTQEQADELEKNWENALQGFYDAAKAPVLKKGDEQKEWGSGKSFNSTLTDEERLKRNMHTDRNSH